MKRARVPPTLADALDLLAALEADESQPRRERRRRDRAFARGLGAALPGDAAGAALAWWQWRRRKMPAPGATSGAALRLMLGVALAVAGAAGVSSASALFFYNGLDRVNVLPVLAVYVALELLLVLMFVAAAVSASWHRRSQGFNPARLVLGLRRLFGPETRRSLERLLGEAEGHRALYGEVYRWALLCTSQAMALTFTLAALLAVLAMITFSDIAFGWATTLGVGSARLHALVQFLATPWAHWWPAAVPSRELIEATRFFRLGGGAARLPPGVGAAELGAWWPFLVACIAVYGALPRLVTVPVARRRLRRALRRALGASPRVRALDQRLREPLVETAGEHPDPPDPDAENGDGAPEPLARTLQPPLAVVNWSDTPIERFALPESLAERLRAAGATWSAAGGNRAPEEDERLLASLTEYATVLVLAKAWEAPTLETRDFIAALARSGATHRPVLVLPLDLDAERLGAARAGHLAEWNHAVRTGGNPNARVVSLA